MVLLDALLAAEEHKSISHVKSIEVFLIFILDELVDTLVEAVCIAAVVGIELGVCPLRQMADQTQRIDDYVLSLRQSG